MKWERWGCGCRGTEENGSSSVVTEWKISPNFLIKIRFFVIGRDSLIHKKKIAKNRQAMGEKPLGRQAFWIFLFPHYE